MTRRRLAYVALFIAATVIGGHPAYTHRLRNVTAADLFAAATTSTANAIDPEPVDVAALERRVAAIEAAAIDAKDKAYARATVRASDLGARVNDPLFDNATVLQSSLTRGRVVELDLAGDYYTSPLVMPAGKSGRLVGALAGYRYSPAGETTLRAFSPATQTHLLEIAGDTTNGAGKIIAVENVGFEGDPPAVGQPVKLDGLRVRSGDMVAVVACSFRNLRVGLDFTYTARMIGPTVDRCYWNACDTGIYANGLGTATRSTTSCLHIRGGSIDAGRVAIHAENWFNGLQIDSLTAQAQSECGLSLRKTYATVRASYFELATAKPALRAMKGSRIACAGTMSTTYANDADSQITFDASSRTGYTLPTAATP